MSTAQETIDADIDKRFLRAVSTELTRGAKIKLTAWYLGIYTGYLRNTTSAVVSGGVVYFGTMAWYGYNYETGDWSKSRPDAEYKAGYNAFREKRNWKPQNRWTGSFSKRPFLADTLKDDNTANGIDARMKGNPTPPKTPNRIRA
jgi:hypothetical protein